LTKIVLSWALPSHPELINVNNMSKSQATSIFSNTMALRPRNVFCLEVGTHASTNPYPKIGLKHIFIENRYVIPDIVNEVANMKELTSETSLQDLKHGSWVLGGGWNNDNWGGELPMASWIDDITPHNPVWLSRMDGHMGLANSLALKIAEISNYTEVSNGGAIMRTTDGEPIGLLIDSAMKLILSCIPEVSVDERREALVRASNLALMREVYRRADVSGQLKIRVCLFFPMNTWSRLQGLSNSVNGNLDDSQFSSPSQQI
ncbi:Protein LONG AFTER FAR-RED 3, partial [Camellia lanceoleosa]